MKYLKKRKVYALAVKLLGQYEMPMCADCSYKAYSGFEWLSFLSSSGYVTFTVKNCGKWIRVHEKSYEGEIILDKVFKPAEFNSLLVEVCA